MSVRLHSAESEEIARLISGIEKDFGIRYPQDAFDACQTVGEVFDIVWKSLPQSAKSSGKCPSLITFHLLKAHMQQTDTTAVFRPGTALTDIDGFSYARMQQDLRRSGWKMPSRHIHGATWVLSIGLALTSVSLLMQVIDGWAFLFGLIQFYYLGLVLHRWVFTQGFPAQLTLGELATAVSHLNAKQLLSHGASFNRHTMWKRFQTALEVDGQIVRESSFI